MAPLSRPSQKRLLPSLGISKAMSHLWTSSNQRGSVSIPLCRNCKAKPVFVENGQAHDYCSRTCASNYEGRQLQPCLLDTCHLTGRSAHGDFCSDEHVKEGVRTGQVVGCTACGVYPRTSRGHCLFCQRQNISTSPKTSQSPTSPNRYEELKHGSSEFKKVKKHFAAHWDPDNLENAPDVEKVYKVSSAADRNKKFSSYQKSMKTLQTFHSTQCICNLGTKGPDLCDFKSCGICTVVKTCFDSFEFGVPYNQGRLGDGIYSYAFAKLADRFATSCTTSPYRVTIACEALVEPNCEIDDHSSVFVPTSDTIMPRFVLMYKK